MRSAWLWSFFVYLALSKADALTLHRRDVPSVVPLGIQRKDIADPVHRDRMRRDQTVGQKLDNEVCLVFVFGFSHLALVMVMNRSYVEEGNALFL